MIQSNRMENPKLCRVENPIWSLVVSSMTQPLNRLNTARQRKALSRKKGRATSTSTDRRAFLIRRISSYHLKVTLNYMMLHRHWPRANQKRLYPHHQWMNLGSISQGQTRQSTLMNNQCTPIHEGRSTGFSSSLGSFGSGYHSQQSRPSSHIFPLLLSHLHFACSLLSRASLRKAGSRF